MKIWQNKRLLLITALLVFQCAYSQDVKYTLDSLVVSSKRTGLNVRDNVITYNISQDPSAALKTMRVLVSSMPLVKYDQIEGKLKINGAENVIILLNGRKSLVVNNSNFNYISEFLRGRDIESISIDISPTGIYSDYSAVINITSKEILSNFYSGSLSGTASTEYKINPSAAITVSLGKLTTNAKYNYGWSDIRPSWNYTESRNADGSASGHYVTSDTTKRRLNSHDLGLSLSYDLTPSDIFFITSTGSFSDGSSKINSLSEIDGIRNSFRNTNKNNDNKGTGSIAYQHLFDNKNQKMLTLQYSLDSRMSNNQYGVAFSENKFTNRQQIVSADYLHTVDKSANWNANLTWFSRKYKSKQSDFVFLDQNQDVLQTTLNASKRLGKFLLAAQTAYDFTSDRADFNNTASHLNDSYGCFRYNIRIQWFPRAGHNVRFHFGRRIYRPDINVRNPYRDESIPGVVSQGNPQLSNEKINNLLLSYMYMKGSKYSVNIMASYMNSSNGVFAVTKILEDGRLLNTYENGIKINKFFVSPSFMWRPNTKLMIDVAYRIGWNEFKSSNVTHSYFDHFANIDITYKAWGGGELELAAQLMNPSTMSKVYTQSTKIHYVVNGFVLLTQHFGKSWVVGIVASQPWNRRRDIILDYEINGSRYYSRNSEPGVIFRASVRYNFGRFRYRVKRNSREVADTDRNKSN